MRLDVENYRIEKELDWHLLRLLRLKDRSFEELSKSVCDMYMGCWEEDLGFIDQNIMTLEEKGLVKTKDRMVKITKEGKEALRVKEEQIERTRESIFSKEATARNALWINVVLSIIKLGAGIITGSAGLIAEGFHTSIDIFASFVTWLGIKIDKEAHAGLIGGVVICVVGLLILGSAIYSIFLGWDLRLEWVAIIIIVINISVNLILMRYKFYVGGRTRSIALVADAYHSKTDIWSSLAVLTGLIGALLGYPVLDSIAGVAVSLFILVGGFRIIIEARRLLKEGEEPELKKFSGYLERHIESVTDMGILYSLWLLNLHPMPKQELMKRMKQGFLGQRFPVPLEEKDYDEIYGRLIDDNLITKESGRLRPSKIGHTKIEELFNTMSRKVPFVERGTIVLRWVGWFSEGL